MNIKIRGDYLSLIKKALDTLPIVILIGARQVGKTTLMKSFQEKHQVSSIFINGQDADIAELFQKYSTIELYFKNRLNVELKGIVYIDEFQYINNVSTMLKLLTDNNPDLKIIASGSSSLDILQKVDETLAGRVRVITVYSLSFSEYILFFDEKLYELYEKYSPDTDFSIIDKNIFLLFKEYLLFGGLPRVAKNRNFNEKIELLNDIYQTYLLRDIRSYIRNEDFVGFNKLLKLLAAQNGNLVNINELSNSSGLSYRKCEEYVHLLDQMYIIKFLEPYETNIRKSIVKMKKVYFTDIGLRNIVYNVFTDIETRPDKGFLFENFVYLELLKTNPSSFKYNFFRTSSGTEVDFIINDHFKKIPIEVKYSMYEKPVQIRALNSFMDHENLKKGYVVNLNNNSMLNEIRYIPGILISKLFSLSSQDFPVT